MTSTTRERFLDQVRQAVARGNRAGHVPSLPERGAVGYQGAGPDLRARFCAELSAAGGQAHVVPDGAAAVSAVLDLLRARDVRRALLGGGAVLDALPLAGTLAGAGIEVMPLASRDAATAREAFFGADVGIGGVDFLIAETGSLALFDGLGQPRSLSLLPPLHVAIAHRGQLRPDLFDLFEGQHWAEQQGLPACISLVTGPSKTGDIELRLVTGVHGPGEVHVVVIDQNW
jgi:L-lactate utilization protein LutC